MMQTTRTKTTKNDVNAYKNILVCVTQQKNCERLIKKAVEIGKPIGADIHVLHVAQENYNFLAGNSDSEALEYLFRCSKAAGANLSVIKSNNIIKAITDYVKNNNIDCTIMGRPHKLKGNNSLVKQIEENTNNIDMILVI